jgi:hypothetical protein
MTGLEDFRNATFKVKKKGGASAHFVFDEKIKFKRFKTELQAIA